MNILIDQTEKKATIYHSRKDMTKVLKVSENTLLNWSKEGIKQKDNFLICFDVYEVKARSKKRKGSEKNFIRQ
jgi:DNA-binding XRE family transcriptional regulator